MSPECKLDGANVPDLKVCSDWQMHEMRSCWRSTTSPTFCPSMTQRRPSWRWDDPTHPPCLTLTPVTPSTQRWWRCHAAALVSPTTSCINFNTSSHLGWFLMALWLSMGHVSHNPRCCDKSEELSDLASQLLSHCSTTTWYRRVIHSTEIVVLCWVASYIRLRNPKFGLWFHQRLFKETTSIGVKVGCSDFLFCLESPSTLNHRTFGIHQISPPVLPGMVTGRNQGGRLVQLWCRCDADVSNTHPYLPRHSTRELGTGKDFRALTVDALARVLGGHRRREVRVWEPSWGKVQKFPSIPDVEKPPANRPTQQSRFVVNLPEWFRFIDSFAHTVRLNISLKFLISNVGFHNFHLFLLKASAPRAPILRWPVSVHLTVKRNSHYSIATKTGQPPRR